MAASEALAGLDENVPAFVMRAAPAPSRDRRDVVEPVFAQLPWPQRAVGFAAGVVLAIDATYLLFEFASR